MDDGHDGAISVHVESSSYKKNPLFERQMDAARRDKTENTGSRGDGRKK